MTREQFIKELASAQRDVLNLSLNAKAHIPRGLVRKLEILSGQFDDVRGDILRSIKQRDKNNAA